MGTKSEVFLASIMILALVLYTSAISLQTGIWCGYHLSSMRFLALFGG